MYSTLIAACFDFKDHNQAKIYVFKRNCNLILIFKFIYVAVGNCILSRVGVVHDL
jgi:hypothetical protein